MFSESNSLNNSEKEINNNENNLDYLFCELCWNLLYPTAANNVLIYKCKNNCNYEKKITKNIRETNWVSRKEFLKEKNLIIDPEYTLDPTMPRNYKNCPKCNFNWCIYLISTDLEDTKIEIINICGDISCGNYWKEKNN